jgi:hypothetical protein
MIPIDYQSKPDNDLALKMDNGTGTDMRGDPQPSICISSVDEHNQPKNKNDLQWSPGRLHGRRHRRFKNPNNYNDYIESFNRFNILEQEEFLVLERRDTAPYNEERFFQELHQKTNIQRKDISQLRNGDLLIKAKSKNISDKLKAINNVMKTSCEVKSHPKLNQVQGTIFCPNKRHLSDSEMKQDWIDQGLSIKEVYRFTRTIDNMIVPTPRVLITFNGLNLPESIWHGWTRLNIRQYIPSPSRCNKFGHVGKYCRAEVETCVRCGNAKHEDYKNPLKCINCGGEHQADDKNCPIFIQEKEILTIKITEKCSHHEARQKIKERFDGVRLYADAAKRHIQSTTDKPVETYSQTTTINEVTINNKRPLSDSSEENENLEVRLIPKKKPTPSNGSPSPNNLITVTADVHPK